MTGNWHARERIAQFRLSESIVKTSTDVCPSLCLGRQSVCFLVKRTDLVLGKIVLLELESTRLSDEGEIVM